MATTGTRTGAKSLKSNTVLKIRWRSSSKYLTMKESAEPKAASGAMTGIATGVRARVAAGAGVQHLLPSMRVLPASLSLPL